MANKLDVIDTATGTVVATTATGSGAPVLAVAPTLTGTVVIDTITSSGNLALTSGGGDTTITAGAGDQTITLAASDMQVNAPTIATTASTVTASSATLAISAIELSHATQNTVTASAGVLSIEGKAVLDQTNTLSGITNKTFVAPVLGAATGTSLALGGATIGSNALAATGTINVSSTGTFGGSVINTSGGFALGTGGSNPRIILLSGAYATLSRVDSSAASSTVIWFGNTFTATSDGFIGFASSTSAGAQDAILMRDGAATIQMGTDAASATAQKFKAHDATTGADGRAGANLTVAGGQPTGTGRGGSLIIQTAPTTATSTSLNSYSERAHWVAKGVNLTDATATNVCSVNIPTGSVCGIKGIVTTRLKDNAGTPEFQSNTTEFIIDAVNKGGTITTQITQTSNTSAVSAGTLTVAVTAVDAGSGVMQIKVNADTSLTPATAADFYALVSLTAINSGAAVTITEV